ncbi:MAG: SxtJ family membrane protein [Candidatus Omnitrophica bacterium]|jgi:hypothetical protein|nr:SxtJ family membrane protein [Candidatus Omnitrophota bacterium]MDD4012782.1 SxtJ family membrane protein [Candidatus Omnitrophota bacterium]
MKKNLTNRELRQFGLMLGGIFCLIGALNLRKGHATAAVILFSLAAVSLILSLAAPSSMKGPHKVMSVIGHAIGWVNTRLILMFIYYFILTPIGLIMRAFGKDPVYKRPDPGAGSYWVPREYHVTSKERLEKQF